MILKTCSKCKKDLPVKRFSRSPRYLSGRCSQCKGCQRATRAIWLKKKPLCCHCKTRPHTANHPYCYECEREKSGKTDAPKRVCDRSNKTLCCKCKSAPRCKNHNYCRDCRKVSVKIWSAKVGGSWTWAKTSSERMKRYRARNALNTAIYRGKLIRKPCEVCGDSKTEGHHHKGYEREFWLDVRWLCKRHHDEAERVEKSLLTEQPLLL